MGDYERLERAAAHLGPRSLGLVPTLGLDVELERSGELTEYDVESSLRG